MKNYLKILLLTFAAFSAACNTATTEKAPTGGENTAVNTETAAANTAEKKSDSKFPPAPAALMSADIKMLDGGTMKLENQQGKVILFNLWATWCGPCRAEMPDLVELQEKYRDKNFEILGLNTDDETVEQINPFVEEMKLNYKIGWADAAMMKEFMKISGQPAIPQSFLIDRTGHLRGVFIGGGPKALEPLKETLAKVISE